MKGGRENSVNGTALSKQSLLRDFPVDPTRSSFSTLFLPGYTPLLLQGMVLPPSSTLSPHPQPNTPRLVLFVWLSHAPGTLHFPRLSHPPQTFPPDSPNSCIPLEHLRYTPDFKAFLPTRISSLTNPVLLPSVHKLACILGFSLFIIPSWLHSPSITLFISPVTS